MIVDLSFIPDELITEELRQVTTQKIEYPYSSSQMFSNNAVAVNPVSRKNNRFITNRMRFRENYKKFELEMFNLARELYRKKDYHLAGKCFRYLVEVGSKQVSSKEYLLKTYIKLRDGQGIKWIKKRLENQLREPGTIPNDTRKLRRILGKYFPLN